MQKPFEDAKRLKSIIIDLFIENMDDPQLEEEYKKIRSSLLSNNQIRQMMPKFVISCRSFSELCDYRSSDGGFFDLQSYRDFLHSNFDELLYELEFGNMNPSEQITSELLLKIDSESIHECWQKALDRRNSDPEGAITIAKTLLETVCKFVLDEAKSDYKDSDDLPKLYKMTAEKLKLAPSQYMQEVFKKILGGCHAIVDGLANVRNKMGDAHPKMVKPSERHAKLAVNLAGVVATFILETYEFRKSKGDV